MSATDLIGALLAGAGTVVSALRWWRVAQREHYYSGGATRFALRWWRATPLNAAVALVALAGCAATPAFGWPAAVAGVVGALAPVGLSPRGETAALSWTRRLRTLVVTTLVLCAAGVVPAALAGGVRGAATVLAGEVLAVPLLVDLSLIVLAPVEARLSARYVHRAVAVLARVRPRVVAITGSYGKTSTKGYLAHLLAARFTVVASPRSFNNRAGLARTVNENLVPGTEVLIAEMGTYGPGEIAALCRWMPPEVAVLTAIGPVHLERFKSLESTLAAKAEITTGARVVVVNVDDARLAAFANLLEAEGRVVRRASGGSPVASAGRADVVVRATDGTLALEVEGALIGEVFLPPGAHRPAPSNVACALAAALALGAHPDELCRRLSSLPGADNRLQRSVTANGVVVLDDTFNANPAGARRALEELSREGSAGGRRVVVTPGMIELGPLQFRENADFAEALAAVATDLVVVRRTNRRALVAGAARAGGTTCAVTVVADREAAVAWVRRELGAGDAVLYENDLPDHFP